MANVLTEREKIMFKEAKDRESNEYMVSKYKLICEAQESEITVYKNEIENLKRTITLLNSKIK